MAVRFLAIAGALVAALTPAADATTAEYCVRQVTFTFTPPLTLARTSGTVWREQTAICVRADAGGGLPYTVGFPGASSGTYVGNCLHAEVAGEFTMTIAGNAAGVLYATYPHYVVADAFVVVPDQVCNSSRLTGVETGPGLWP